jgi:hypothetical protein
MSGKLLDGVSECTWWESAMDRCARKGVKSQLEESELLTPKSIQIAPTDHN